MDDRDDGDACDDEDPANFGNGGRQIIDVVKGHEGHGQVATRVRERQFCRTRASVIAGRVHLSGSGNQRRRHIYSDHPVPETFQVTGQSTLAASDVYRQLTRSGQQREELVSVEPPIRIMAGCPRPPNPVCRLLFPPIAERHVLRVYGELSRVTLHSTKRPVPRERLELRASRFPLGQFASLPDRLVVFDWKNLGNLWHGCQMTVASALRAGDNDRFRRHEAFGVDR